MPKTAKPSALPVTGRVTARSPYGIKIDDIEDWFNFSKPEYRETPWEADDVQKGDYVDMKVSGTFIKSIALVEPPTGERMVNELGEWERPTSRDRPPEDGPFEGIETEPARSPVATARDESIQRQVALYAAVQLAVGMQGKIPEGAQAGPLNTEFVLSIYRKFRSALAEEAK